MYSFWSDNRFSNLVNYNFSILWDLNILSKRIWRRLQLGLFMIICKIWDMIEFLIIKIILDQLYLLWTTLFFSKFNLLYFIFLYSFSFSLKMEYNILIYFDKQSYYDICYYLFTYIYYKFYELLPEYCSLRYLR